MPSLIDIGDLTETVEIRGKQLTVQGISAEGIMKLLADFPDLRKVVTGKADEESIDNLIQQFPDATAAILAHGTGCPGDPAAIAKVKTLGVGEQVDILVAIWKLTFPRGVKSFLKALEMLAGEVVEERGKEADTKLPEPSNDASATVIHQTELGGTRRAS